MALKNSSSSEKSGRWRFDECYANEHIIVDFRSIFKSFNGWISSKKNIFMRVIGWWNVVIIFKNRINCTLRFYYIAIMNNNLHIVQWFTYCSIQQIKREWIDGVNNYILHIINRLTTLCRTSDTSMRTFKHLMMMDLFKGIKLFTSCMRANKLYPWEHSHWNRVRTFILLHLICINFIEITRLLANFKR